MKGTINTKLSTRDWHSRKCVSVIFLGLYFPAVDNFNKKNEPRRFGFYRILMHYEITAFAKRLEQDTAVLLEQTV